MPLFDSDFRLIPCFSRGHVNVTASSDRHLDRFHAGSQTAGFHERDVICWTVEKEFAIWGVVSHGWILQGNYVIWMKRLPKRTGFGDLADVPLIKLRLSAKVEHIFGHQIQQKYITGTNIRSFFEAFLGPKKIEAMAALLVSDGNDELFAKWPKIRAILDRCGVPKSSCLSMVWNIMFHILSGQTCGILMWFLTKTHLEASIFA